MSNSNRTSLLNKTLKVLKKHYKPAAPPPSRSLLEMLLFACCLENSPAAVAEKVFADLKGQFFDWNEARVTTIRELAEVMQPLLDSEVAARRLKGVLQSVFETLYSFDLEFLRKQNLGQAIKKLEKYEGTTPYSIAYLTQVGLGGHSIPLNRGALGALQVLGFVADSNLDQAKVPGLERAVSKSKGMEVGSLLHQLGVDFRANPFAAPLRELLLEIDPTCKNRLPKRPSKKPEPSPPPTLVDEPKSKPSRAAKASEPKGSEGKPAAAPQKKLPAKKTPAKGKQVPRKGPSAAGVRKSSIPKKSTADHLSKRKPR
jgi:endonuclease-3